jgi:hypothetical protein
MDGARRDFENHRRPDVNNRDEYRRPAVSRDLREVYRDGFRRGYERAVSHFWGTPDMPMRAPDMPMRQPDRVVSPPDRGGWEAPPSEFSEVQRRGFRDGMEGARKDVDNHRRPDVNNRDEYRHPDVPYELRRQYREAFRRGYDVAMSHLMH